MKKLQLLRKNHILFCILAASFIIRVIGLVPGFNPYHPDEQMSYSSAVLMAINGDFNPGRFDYPSGVPLIHYFIYSQFILPFILFKIVVSSPQVMLDFIMSRNQFFDAFNIEIFGKREIYALFWSRHIAAVMGTISVFMTYLIGSKLFNKRTGLFAAFFLAFNYRHVLSSHFALSDVPNGLFSLIAFFCSILLFKKNSLKNYLLAGFFLGISFSMKYQIFPAFSLLVVHLYWVFKEKKIAYLFSKKIFLAFFLAVFVFSITNVHFFLNFDKAMYWVEMVFLRYGSGFNRFSFYPLYYLFYFGIGPLPFFIIILGVLFGLIRFPLKTILMLTFIVPFLFVFLYYMRGGVYVRNFTTVIPFLMVFAGLFFSFTLNLLVKIVQNRSLAAICILLFLIIANLTPIRNSLILSINYIKPWNRGILTSWAEKNLPKEALVANDNLALDYDRVTIKAWNVNEENSVSELAEQGFDFAVANTDWRQSLLYWWFSIPPSELIKYKRMPYTILDNSYNGIAMQEFLQYVVFEVYKPWQTAETNYYISKIPPTIKNLSNEIYSFDFDKDKDGWYAIDIYNTRNIKGFDWDKSVGNAKKGSLVYKGGDYIQENTRITSNLMPIKPGKIYTVTGFIKTEDELPKARERDGFLRLDFYEDKNSEKVYAGGINKSVSGRAYGTKNWVEKQTSMKAPKNANFLTISLQKDSYGGRVWLDDVKIYETDKMPENFPKVPYIQSTIPKEVLYPNSIL